MHLRDWIRAQEITHGDAATRLGVPVPTLRRWLYHEAIPDHARLLDIETRTELAVTVYDWPVPRARDTDAG